MTDEAEAPAPSLEEKLAVPVVRFDSGKARRTLAQLRSRLWPLTSLDGFKEPPARLEFAVMDKREVWVRAKDGSKGESTTYELERGP